MFIIEALLVSCGLSFDTFAFTVYTGSMLAHVHKKRLVLLSILVALIQCLAFALGLLFSQIPIFNFQTIEFTVIRQTVPLLIFIGLGIIMLNKARKKEVIIESRKEYSFRDYALLSMITSIDALFAGFAFGIISLYSIITFISLFFITMIFSILGIIIGYRLGYGSRKIGYLIGGSLLIMVGFETLFNFFH